MKKILNAALSYVKNGLAVLLLAAGTKVPLKGSRGFKDATCDLKTIRDGYKVNPNANLGIATGLANRLFVLDVDFRSDGDRTLREFERIHGELLCCPAAVTPGGLHFYFEYPDDGRIIKSRTVAAGLDIKGNGGYVVAPPSYRSDVGKHYRWKKGRSLLTCPLGIAPDWLLDLACTSSASLAKRGPAIATSDWSDVLKPAGEGARHSNLLTLAGLLFRNLPAEVAFELAHAWSESRFDPPLPQGEVNDIVDWVATQEYSRYPKGVRYA